MGIQDKIEDIRRMPEHVRLRYVYLFTAVSAILIIIIWVISLSGRESQPTDSNSADTQELMNSLTEQKKSLKDTALDVKSAMDQAKTLQDSAK